MDGRDRRKYRRLLELSPIEFTMGDVGLPSYTKVVMLLHSMNISGGGVLVVSNVALKEDFTMEMTLNLRTDWVKARGKVIRCSNAVIPGLFEIAIEFVDIDGEARRKLAEFIRQRTVKEESPPADAPAPVAHPPHGVTSQVSYTSPDEYHIEGL